MQRRAVSLLLVVLTAGTTAGAAEYRGAVKVSGLPLPGATVSARQGELRVITTTDDNGTFRFPELADGKWTVEAEMLGFAPASREVTVAAGIAAGELELKMLGREALVARMAAGADAAVVVKAAAPVVSAPGAPAAAAAPAPVAQVAAAKPAAPVAARPKPSAGGGRQGQAGATPQRRAEFQQVNVNQSADAATLANDTSGMLRQEEAADLTQSAASAFVVQGSVSSAVGMQQQNDWGFRGPFGGGPEGMMGGGMGMGGAMGMGMGMSGPNGDGPGNMQQASAGGGPGGPGGPGGFSGRGGPSGGGPPGGFGGGPGGPPGGFGGRGGGPGGGGPGGGRGGDTRGGSTRGTTGRGGTTTGRPEWMGRTGSVAFGNSRRNPRAQYMGSLNMNVSNSALDARVYSVTGAAVDKPDYSNIRMGVMFGGPLRIPKLIKPEKQIMFTVDFNVGRNRTGTVSDPVNMPTLLERAGDFSQTQLGGAPVTIWDPLSGQPFAGNKIPASRINASSAALLKYFPEPNLPFAARNYQTSWQGENNTLSLNSRISNIRIKTKDRLNFNFGLQDSDSVSPNLLRFVDTGAGRGLNTGLQWTRNISSRLINNAGVNFSRNRQQALPFFANVANIAAQLGIQGTSQNPNNWGPPNLRFTNYSGLNDGNFMLNRSQSFALTESLLWIRGNKSFTFGVSYRKQQNNALSDSNGRGTYTFNGQATSAYAGGIAQNGSGWDLADFLLAVPATSSIRYGNPDKYFRGSGVDLFANNDWRISQQFSINMGIRWDYTTPATELYGRMVNLSLAPGFASVTQVVAGQGTLIKPDRNNFSPRFGFALRPIKGDSLVIRGGYGVYYNTSVYNQIASNLAQQPPFAQVLSVSGNISNPLNLQTGFLIPGGSTGLGTYAIDPNYRVGYAQSWQLSVQHDLPFSLFGTIGYLGTKGTRLDQQILPNSTAPGAVQSTLPQGYTYEISNGNSIYHAAQFQLNRRFRSGFMANTSYQFSKAIDNAGTGGRGQGGTPVAQNWLDYSAERGLSSFDSRHSLSIMGQYSTAMGRSAGTLIKGFRGKLIKDWTITSMLSMRSGSPFTATVGGNRSQVLGTAVSNTVRANATGLPVSVDGMLFNTAAFSEPLPGQWGNAGRNTIPGPTTLFLNSGLSRIFRIAERRSIDIQAQAQNVLNRVVITQWGTVLGSNNYGLGTNAASMRRISLSIRFRF
ncbi:MAG: TonB-dependent receptor [Bryobacteraceae bacterium]|nr:TonB-dependent receptor [Bryobacteraceae bacterium]